LGRRIGRAQLFGQLGMTLGDCAGLAPGGGRFVAFGAGQFPLEGPAGVREPPCPGLKPRQLIARVVLRRYGGSRLDGGSRTLQSQQFPLPAADGRRIWPLARPP